MSKIVPALRFLRNDLDKAKPQWREGEQWKSLLQREGVDMYDLLDIFDPQQDEQAWMSEYSGERDSPMLNLHRVRMAYLKASRKEWHEEYDLDVTDVDFMRLLELPFTDPKYPLDYCILVHS